MLAEAPMGPLEIRLETAHFGQEEDGMSMSACKGMRKLLRFRSSASGERDELGNAPANMRGGILRRRLHLAGDEGSVLVIMGICMTVMLGFMGVAVDIGLVFHDRQNVQIAADAAATAAALDYLHNDSVWSAQVAGKAAAAKNGYTDGSGGVSVTVNLPPQSGPILSTNYAEAIVTAPSMMSFMRVLGKNSMNVASRAVAGDPQLGSACIWVLAPTGTGMTLQGAFDIDAKACGIYVNSSDANAVAVTGNGGYLLAAYVDAVGSNVGHQTSPTPISTDTPRRSSPWGNLTSPKCSQTFSGSISMSSSNQSTYYASAANPVICFSGAVTMGNGVNLPGAQPNANGVSTGYEYVFEDGVEISTGATVTLGTGTYDSTTQTFESGTTQGAVLDLQGGTLNQDSNSVLNVYAPNAGTYNGIAIMQPATNTNQLQVQFGSNNETMNGYIYAPGAQVYLQDHGGGITAGGVVAYTLFDKSSTMTIHSYDLENAGTTINRSISLVE